MVFKVFPSFFDHPLKIRFIEQEEGEIIELFLRQHPILNLGWVLLSILGFIFPPIFFRLDQILNINLTLGVPASILIGGLIIWYLLLLAYVAENFLYWYFNIYIVTNRHIVDINFHSLLARDITEVLLTDIESVSSQVSGVFGPLFNFGHIKIETAAKGQIVDFANVPKPDLVADRIDDLRGSLRNGAKHE